MLHFYFLWAELLSFLMSLLFLRMICGSKLILFVPFLFLTNIVEWGSRYGYFTFHHSNNWVLNIFSNVEFLFYSFLFYTYTSNPVFKRRIWYIFGAYVLLSAVNIFFIQGPERFHSYTFLLGSLMIIYFCCNFYFELMRMDRYVNLLRYPLFWIVSGLLFFYCGMFCYFIFYETYAYRYFIEYYVLFNVLTNIFNILLYSCFSVAFICQPRNRI